MKPAVIFTVIFSLVLIVFAGSKFASNSSTKKTVTAAPFPTSQILPTPTDIPQPTPNTSPPSIKSQLLQATYGPPNGFIPTEFKVKAGQPVRLEVQATEDGIGCMGSIMVPEFTGAQFFKKGKTNILEFTLPSPGEYPITCAMGIPHGFILAE